MEGDGGAAWRVTGAWHGDDGSALWEVMGVQHGARFERLLKRGMGCWGAAWG